MSDDGALRYFDDGSELWELENGGYVLFDATGEPVQAEDATGEALDPAGIAYPYDDDLEDPRREYPAPGYAVEDDVVPVDDVEEQIAELQAWRENFDPMAQIEQARAMGQQASGAFAEQAWADNIGRELRNLEQSLGRALTQTETWAVLEEAHGDYQAGGTADFDEAVDRAGLVPFRPGQTIEGQTDHQRAEARAEYAMELVADAERQAEGREPDDAPAWVEPADDSDIARITANAQNALNYPNQED